MSETHLYLNPVKADRADDFEEWLRTVVEPAVRQHRPEQVGRVRTLRGTESADGVVMFAFVFEGDLEEFELDPILEAALGPDGAAEAGEYFLGMFAADQYGWEFRDVGGLSGG